MKNKKYNSLTEWIKDNPSEYIKANSNGWTRELCILNGWENKVPRGYWTRERCLEDAKKYKSKKEWRVCKGAAYDVAKKKGWFKECCEHMMQLKTPSGYWTKEKCIEEAKKYTTRGEWHKALNGSATSARLNGWFEECVSHMIKVHKTWDKESIFAEAKKHKTKFEWNQASSQSYKSAKKNGWFDECIAHMIEVQKPFGYWNKERCVEDARKYNSVKEWRQYSQKTYQKARVNDWLKECITHLTITIKPRGYWTKERCIEEAKKYKSKKEWREKSSTSYNSAMKNGCREECFAHMTMVQRPAGYWTKERCLEAALKYTQKTKWQRGPDVASYSAAYKYGWFAYCTKHMK
tara:strand:+ start:1340 stop:2386 length:1047 start_codon:yes stop_codon:yes gene_type:complete